MTINAKRTQVKYWDISHLNSNGLSVNKYRDALERKGYVKPSYWTVYRAVITGILQASKGKRDWLIIHDLDDAATLLGLE